MFAFFVLIDNLNNVDKRSNVWLLETTRNVYKWFYIFHFDQNHPGLIGNLLSRCGEEEVGAIEVVWIILRVPRRIEPGFITNSYCV